MPKPANKPIIAVDIDEVLSPLRDLYFAHHNAVYGTSFPLDNPNYFMDRLTGDSNQITREKLKKFVDSEAFKNIKPLKGAIEVINNLKKEYRFVIITGRQDFYYDFTHDWLKSHFPDTFENVYFSEHVTGKGLKIAKSEFCQKIGASYIIDDHISNVEDCSKAGIRALLFGNYPWNKANKLPKNATRVKDWQDVLEYFNEQSRRRV